MTEEVVLSFPRAASSHPVAHLVLSGLAVRLDLTIESLEDLQLALGTLLERTDRAVEPRDVVVRMRLHDHELEAVVGPLGPHILDELEREPGPQDGIGLRRVLDSTVDDVHVDGTSVRLTKRVVV
jgi:hypothetical protein